MADITAFAIAPQQNSGGKNDATGAFLPGAQKFAKAYQCTWRSFDNTGSGVRKRFFDEIENHCPGGLNLFAYFGHGIPGGLPSAHCYGDDIDDFLKILLPKIAKPFVAVFYACSSGSPGGFTGKLRERLGGDVWVYGHTTVGHSFLNPDVSEEASGGSPTFRLLYGEGDELRGPWADALKYTDLWLRFPMMDDDDIDAELCGRRVMGKWEVTGGAGVRQYQFDWQPSAWSAGMDIDPTPKGKVVVVDSKKPASVLSKGDWEITDKLCISWDSGTSETWPLPIKVVGQQGGAGASTIKARRIARPEKLGTIQG